MKYLGLLLLPFFLLSCTRSNSQNKSSDTAMSAEEMKAMHPAPKPYEYKSERGMSVTFPAGSMNARGFEVKAFTPSGKYLLVFPEWWGLNGYIQHEADSLAKDLQDVNVLALDLYDGKVATTPDEASKLSSSVDSNRIYEIIKGALAHIPAGARIATLGWCFGGGYALRGSLIGDGKIAATVIYYGLPVTDVHQLKNLSGPVLGLYGTQDKYINPDLVKQFQTAMKAAGKSLEVHSYDADHAFANPSNPKHNEAATEDAHNRAIAFLKSNLR